MQTLTRCDRSVSQPMLHENERRKVANQQVSGQRKPNVRKDTGLNFCSNLFYLIYFACSYFKPPSDFFWDPSTCCVTVLHPTGKYTMWVRTCFRVGSASSYTGRWAGDRAAMHRSALISMCGCAATHSAWSYQTDTSKAENISASTLPTFTDLK